jgi:hypothetical protein
MRFKPEGLGAGAQYAVTNRDVSLEKQFSVSARSVKSKFLSII